jgi:hypothetical protein
MIAFGSKAQNHALSALVKRAEDVLNPLGFKKQGLGEWIRQSCWKAEEIDLVIKGGTLKHVLPSFRVLIPLTTVSPSGEAHQHIAQINIARMLRPNAGPDFDVKVPNISFRTNGFVKSIMADITAALPWFDQFASPAACKASLAKYLKPGCPAYVDAEKYLDSVSGGTDGQR